MTRTSYHHGDLRAALVQAAVEAARTGGADGVRLTRLAQQLGVSAAAAYRHFPDGLDGLLAAVGDVGRSELAAAIRTATDDVVAGDPVERATRRFRASGQAYVAHVTGSPGLFQVACRYEGGGAADPFRLLEAAWTTWSTSGCSRPNGDRSPPSPRGQPCTGCPSCSPRGPSAGSRPRSSSARSTGRSTWSPPASDGAYSWPVCDSPVAGSTVCAATPGCSGLSSGSASSRAWSAETEGSSAGPLGTGSVMAAPGGSRV